MSDYETARDNARKALERGRAAVSLGNDPAYHQREAQVEATLSVAAATRETTLMPAERSAP